MSAVDVLRSARARIESPARRCLGAAARDASGNVVDPGGPEAVCWCPIAAIVVEGGHGVEAASAYDTLALTVGGLVGRWSDSSSHEEVLAGFDRAIAALEARPDRGREKRSSVEFRDVVGEVGRRRS